MKAFRLGIGFVGVFALLAAVAATPAQAGCGCEKAPPDAAEIRPHATYAGSAVTLFHPALEVGTHYTVTFASGTTAATASVKRVPAVTRRDLADGVYTPQLVVVLPALPLGPTSVTVTDKTGTVMVVDDAAFTVVPSPVTFHAPGKDNHIDTFQAAVGRDGTVYFSINLANMNQPRVFRTQARGYPLRFTSDDVAFYNTQGFLMQLLDASMPGLYSIESANGAEDSDILGYSRHEFNTYFLQHGELQPHAIDPADPNWHADGTPHIEHKHLIVAIAGVLDDGSEPAPGATPPFELVLRTFSFFDHGLVGRAAVTMENETGASSYSSLTGTVDDAAAVLSNGTVSLLHKTRIDGDATAAAFDIGHRATITGKAQIARKPTDFLRVERPDFLDDLGSLRVEGHDVVVLGPGSYHAAEVVLTGQSTLQVDNAAGPVTVYVSGPVTVDTFATVSLADADPEKFALYVMGPGPVELASKGQFYGVVYAPEAAMYLVDDAELFGAFVGDTLTLSNKAHVYFDTALRGEAATSDDQGDDSESSGDGDSAASDSGDSDGGGSDSDSGDGDSGPADEAPRPCKNKNPKKCK